MKCQVGPVPCGGSNNYCFNPDEAGACTGKTLSFTVFVSLLFTLTCSETNNY